MVVWHISHVDSMKNHKSHYFVVDKSNLFSTCSICGLKRPRKIIGWATKDT